jgi:hypothetical protein
VSIPDDSTEYCAMEWLTQDNGKLFIMSKNGMAIVTDKVERLVIRSELKLFWRL